jgi:hypothetical protein
MGVLMTPTAEANWKVIIGSLLVIATLLLRDLQEDALALLDLLQSAGDATG